MSGWLRFVARRLGLMLVTLLIVALAIFVITELVPGDAARITLGQSVTDEALSALRERLGLDQPAPARFVTWLTNALRGDLGYSVHLNGDVAPELALRLRNSIVLGLFGLVVAVPLAIGLGVIAAVYAGRLLDRMISITTLLGLSLPEFVTAVLLTLVFSSWLGWLPPSSLREVGAAPWENFNRLVLPAITVTLVILAYIARMTRGSVIDVLGRPYIRAARLRGLPWRVVIVKHTLRNALLPTVTVIFNSLGWIFGGLVIVETFFAYPGIARLLLAGLERNDFPLLQASALVVATITVLANFAADVSYALLNPRVRY